MDNACNQQILAAAGRISMESCPFHLNGQAVLSLGFDFCTLTPASATGFPKGKVKIQAKSEFCLRPGTISRLEEGSFP